MAETFPCAGHEGKCEFCKKEEGSPRSIGGMPEIDRFTGERVVDPCCKACANNLKKANKEQFRRTSIS